MQYFNSTDIQSWERFYRANLLSCLSGYKPAMLVGTVSTGGTFNVALFQNIVHLGANPALIGLINRPRQATPHTLANIEATGCFTLNTVHQGMQQAAHQTSAKYNELTSEFTVTGLTPQLRDGFVAPYVQQSVISLGLTVQQIVPIT
ncbi:MAG TPA: flavin reductase, partial [Phnomibacter sp.]|nr:flavin reductase [Phnomibacter sp.]